MIKLDGEPYRALFTLGLLNGAVGVGVWLLYPEIITSHPMLSHAYTMFFGFFLSFVSGFLLTALPRMSGTAPASRLEILMPVVLISAGVLAAFTGHLALAYGCSTAQLLSIFIFAVRRRGTGGGHAPPPHFIFIPAGLLWGGFGALVQVMLFSGATLPPALAGFSQVAVQQAFLLNLIVGLGGRLIPFLTHVQKISPLEPSAQTKGPIVLIFSLLNLTFLVEGFGWRQSAWLMRAAVLVLAAVLLFKIHLVRPVSSFLGAGLRASILMMIAGYAMLAFLPSYQTALLHSIFIGGFSLITLMVATRVILSHGGFSLETERSSWFVLGAAVLLLSAAFLRGLYFLPAAALLWLLAAVVWFYRVGRLVFKG